MRGLNLDQLRTFATVVEQKSFSGAAARLGVTQPAVSLQVRQLEKRFGVKLIERVGRRAAPTAAGADLLTHARDVEAALAAASEAMAPHAQGAAGPRAARHRRDRLHLSAAESCCAICARDFPRWTSWSRPATRRTCCARSRRTGSTWRW